MSRVTDRVGTLGTSTRQLEDFGFSPEEFKTDSSQVLPPELSPLQSQEISDLIGSSRASDQIRLHVPTKADPFMGLNGPERQDHFLLKQVIEKGANKIAIELVDLLQSSIEGVSDESLGFMRASLVREHNMLELLKRLTASMGYVHNQIIGNQEG